MTFRSLAGFFAPVLAVVALTAGAYHGDRASISFPDGWSGPEAGQDGIVTFKEPSGAANCNVQTKDLATLKDSTLQEINTAQAHVYTAAEWADFLGVPAADLTVIASDLLPFADAYFHTATLRVKTNGIEVMIRYGFYLLPGRATMAGCYARPENHPTYAAVFDKTIASLRPW